jgi:hypothetical protein
MRNPGRLRTIALGFVASGVVTGAVAATPDASAGMRAALGIYGGLATLIGAISAWILQRDVQAQAALTRGEDVLARWRVAPENWRRFVAADAARDATPLNELAPRDDAPVSGVEVIVGRTAILIGDMVRRLPLRGAPEVTHAALYEGVTPAVVELRLYHPGTGREGTGQGPLRTRFTFPVAVGALHDAQRVVAEFSDRTAPPDFFHGRGDGSDPEDLSRCWSCGFETHRYGSQCPKCGSALQSRRWSRRAGIVSMLCGALITALMAVVGVSFVPMLLHPGQDFGGTRFAGGPVVAGVILLILTVVTVLGVTALGYGLWQTVTGARNRRVAGAVVILFLVLLATTLGLVMLG